MTITNVAEDFDLVIGVDTHTDTHTAAVCDPLGRCLGELTVATTPAGYAELLTWATMTRPGSHLVWAVEGTRHYGLGLTRFLLASEQRVHEIDRARRIGKRRNGKSDSIDAVRAAKELLARSRPGQVRADGDREALRLLMIDRDHAVKARKTARTILSSLIVTAPAELREQLRGLSWRQRPKTCAALVAPTDAPRAVRVLHQTLARLGQRIERLGDEIDELETEIADIVDEVIPGLVASEPGCGPLSAAQLILSWSHAGRIHSEAAFAKLSGTAPLEVSSGRTDRHRLNRLGDRQLNRALHVIATNRIRHHPPTRDYVARRTAEGKTLNEIRRCVKRYLARHLFRTLNRLDTT